MICTVRDDGALCGCTDCTAAGTEHRKAETVALLERIGAEQKRANTMQAQATTAEAQRVIACGALLRLERAVRAVGGHMSDEMTSALRFATSILQIQGFKPDDGLRAPVAPPWADSPPPWLK